MEICNSNHEEIVYSKGLCPLCEVLAEIEDYKQILEVKEREIERLENVIEQGK